MKIELDFPAERKEPENLAQFLDTVSGNIYASSVLFEITANEAGRTLNARISELSQGEAIDELLSLIISITLYWLVWMTSLTGQTAVAIEVWDRGELAASAHWSMPGEPTVEPAHLLVSANELSAITVRRFQAAVDDLKLEDSTVLRDFMQTLAHGHVRGRRG